MNEVLSQDEIDQLLTAISSGDTEADDFKPVNSARKIKIYDFKRPTNSQRNSCVRSQICTRPLRV